jgi:hypothetical protein
MLPVLLNVPHVVGEIEGARRHREGDERPPDAEQGAEI